MRKVMFIISLFGLLAGAGSGQAQEWPEFVVESAPQTGLFRISGTESGQVLVERGPFVRVSREPSIAEHRAYFSSGKKYWQPLYLEPGRLLERAAKKAAGHTLLAAKYEFVRPGDDTQHIIASILLDVSPEGWIDVDYTLQPVNAQDYFLEFGVSFLLPREMRFFSWHGAGPRAANWQPGEHAGVGIYRFMSVEHLFSGNKTMVDVAAVVDAGGNGIGILGKSENIACNNVREGVLLSHNALVSGQSTERQLTAKTLDASRIQEAKGHFRLVPLFAGNWPEAFQVLQRR